MDPPRSKSGGGVNRHEFYHWPVSKMLALGLGKSTELEVLLAVRVGDVGRLKGVEDKKIRLKLLAEKSIAGKDYAGASKFYTEAIKLDPADATLYSNRNFCHLKIGEAWDALCDANACVRLQPSWPKSYYPKGAALMSLKGYKEAFDAFMDGLLLDPANADTRNAYWEASEAMRKEHSARPRALSLD